MNGGTMLGGAVFFLVWLMFMVGGIAGYIILLVAVWKLMRAHESLADTAQEALALLRDREQSPPR